MNPAQPKQRLGVTLLAVALCGCAETLPASTDFAEDRCQTVYSEGAQGLPLIDIGAILGTNPPGGTDTDALFESRGMQLAVAELNDNRDIAGKRIRLTVCDTRSHWSTGGGQITRDLVRWLVEKRGVQAILTDASSDTQTAQAVAVPKGVLLMAISATSEDLTSLNDKGLVWRVAPSDVYQGAVLAHVATKGLQPADKVSVLAAQSPYGEGLVNALGKVLKNRMVPHTFGSDGKGIAAAVGAAAGDGSKALVVVGSSAQLVQVVNARVSQPSLANLPLFSGDGACEGGLLQNPVQAGASLASLQCTRPGQAPTELYKLFAARFKAKFNQTDPAQSGFTQHAYDAVYCLALAYAHALRTGGPAKVDGAAIAEGLRQLSAGETFELKPNDIAKMTSALGKGAGINIEGTSGPLDFNPDTGEAPSDYAVWGAGKDGKLTNLGYFAVQDKGKDGIAVLPKDVTPP